MHPEAIVATSITTVVQILEREYREREELTYNERRELEALVGELRLLQAFLKDSSKMEEMSEVFKEKERQIRELAYELEDTIERCLVKKAAEIRKRSRFATTARSLREKVDYGMAREVRSIREKKVKRIIEMLEKDFGKTPSSEPVLEEPFTQVRLRPPWFIQGDAPSTWHDRGESHKPERTVDFEDEAKIISLLMEQAPRLDIISITGMPGLGKTTLARKIFADETIRRTFPLLVWIGASQKLKIKDALLKVSKEIMAGEGTPLPSDKSLIPYVRHTLAKKKFLMVIDDVWTVEDLEIVRDILAEENVTGKVLVTTRRREIAVQANIFREPYGMSLLGQDKSLELLKLKVFGDPGICPPELEGIAKDIAEKCGGLPLSLVVIGGILKRQFTKTRAVLGVHEKWSNVLENFYEILMKDEGSSMGSSLKLSYNALPNDHKPCFLYAGLFPEEHEIKVSELIRLWIDEGFVQPNGRRVEETAEEILDDLINMNLITVATKILDRVRTCRVHDVIREFCKAKAREENIFGVLKESNGVMDRPKPEARRLCLHSDPSKMFSAEPEVPRVRSLLCFLDEPVHVDPKHLSTMIDTFDVLRIISCKSVKFGEMPKFSRLLLLKHITMSIDALDVVPKYISKLPNLRTFVVYTAPISVITVKADIWDMAEMQCFKTNAAFVLDDRKWKGKGSRNLETVSNLSPQSCSNTLGRKAPNLTTLGIRGDVVNLFTTFSLESVPLLKSLKVVNESLLHQPIVLPQPHSFPVNLTRLTLSKTKLVWKTHMPTLATIKGLKVLKLKHEAFVGSLWVAEPDCKFDEIQLLHLESSDLLTWRASPDHFPRLRCLVIKDCKGLSEFPTSLVKNLDELEVKGVSTSLADYAREIEAVQSQAALQNQEQYSVSGVPFKLTIT